MRGRLVQKSYVLIITIIAILCVILGFKYILPLFIPFVFSYFFAWIAEPIVNYITIRFRINRNVASITILCLFVIIFGAVAYILVRIAFEQICNFIDNYFYYETRLLINLQSICNLVDKTIGLAQGSVYQVMESKILTTSSYLNSDIFPAISNQAVNVVKLICCGAWNFIIAFIAALLLLKDYSEYKLGFQQSYFYKEIHGVTQVLSDLGIAYLKAQLILLCIIAGICMIGLTLIGNRYGIIVAVCIALFDAFPVLGSAFILIPYGIVLLLKKEFVKAIIIFVTFLLCQLTRQYLEPKLVGERIGIKPLYTLIAMYVGFKVYGVMGFILGPISLIAIHAIIKETCQKMNVETD